LVCELNSRNLKVESEVTLFIVCKGVQLDCGYRIDIPMKNKTLLELRSVEKFILVHFTQIISYLKLADKKLGFLVSLNLPLLKSGIN
jgi:GxxExxY protein